MSDNNYLPKFVQPHGASTAQSPIGLTIPGSRFGTQITKLDDDALSYPVEIDRQLFRLDAENYQPFWHRIEKASSYSSIDGSGRTAGIVDFDIDLYRHGTTPLSFNVKCILLVTPHQSKTDLIEHLSRAQISNINENQQWIDMKSLRSSDAGFNSNVVSLMQRLFLGSISAQRPALIDSLSISPEQLEISKSEFQDIVRNADMQNDDGVDELRSAFKIHFARFPFSGALRSYIEQGRVDVEIASLAMQALTNEASVRGNNRVAEYILELASSHPKASIRYAAVEALSAHLDDHIRSILAVRLKDEKNRTVASSLSAALN